MVVVNGIKNMNFHWSGVDESHDSDFSDETCDHNYCSCSEISNIRVTDVDIPRIVSMICEKYNIEKEIDIYGLDRLLRINRIYSPKVWEVDIENGYYGQEIGSIKMEPDLANSIEKKFNGFVSLKNMKEKIEFLLNLEYGYVLEDLKKKDCSFEIKTVKRDDIYFSAENYVKRVADEEFYSDENYSGIRGLVKETDAKYRVIDGYHRIVATKQKTVKVIVARFRPKK